MRLQLKIVELLENEKELTINQIAKKLKESYSFVNRIVNAMIKENILLKESVGHSFLCRLNLANDTAKALFILNETNKKKEFFEKNKDIKLISEEIIKKIPEANMVSIFGSYAKNTQTKESDIDVLIFTDKKIDSTELVRSINSVYNKEISPIIITKDDFKKNKTNENANHFQGIRKPSAFETLIREVIKSHIIINGFEEFIKMIQNEA
jgi:predicted nucleotidyltransferase